MNSAANVVREVLPSLKDKYVAVFGKNINSSFRELVNTNAANSTFESKLPKTGLKKSFDVVIYFGALNECTDEEAFNILSLILCLTKKHGHVYLCETCFKLHEGDVQTIRMPATVSALLENISTTVDGSTTAFQIERIKPIQNPESGVVLDLVWIAKVYQEEKDFHGFSSFKRFLDGQQYNFDHIQQYEIVFGKHFISTGGYNTTKAYVKELNLQPGQLVLDVGAGIGGSAFHMAEVYGAEVLGIDLSSNMLSLAWKSANQIQDNKVRFELCDATNQDYKAESFDVIYSRDTILHIKEKANLFHLFYKWLKPGGQLLISDYVCKDGAWSDEYTNYVKQRGYHLVTVEQYGKLLEEAGFTNVSATDASDLFLKSLEEELIRLKEQKDFFIKMHSEEKYYSMEKHWTSKIRRTKSGGEQLWGKFHAFKCSS